MRLTSLLLLLLDHARGDCADWCKHDQYVNTCSETQCIDCGFCDEDYMTEDIDLSTANSYDESTDDTSAFAAASYDDQQLVDETCQPWCNAHTCNDGRCTTCDVCEAGDDGDNTNHNAGAQAGGGAAVEESTGCAAWCVAEELYDTCGEVDQCGGCEACVAKRDAAAAAAGTTPCPTWYVCSHSTRHILLFFSLPSLLTTPNNTSHAHTHTQVPEGGPNQYLPRSRVRAMRGLRGGGGAACDRPD